VNSMNKVCFYIRDCEPSKLAARIVNQNVDCELIPVDCGEIFPDVQDKSVILIGLPGTRADLFELARQAGSVIVFHKKIEAFLDLPPNVFINTGENRSLPYIVERYYRPIVR